VQLSAKTVAMGDGEIRMLSQPTKRQELAGHMENYTAHVYYRL